MKPIIAALLLMAGSLAHGQIVMDKEYPAHQFIRVGVAAVAGMEEDESVFYEWEFPLSLRDDAHLYMFNDRESMMVAPPGEYEISVVQVITKPGTRPNIVRFAHKFKVLGHVPDPVPPVPPTPPTPDDFCAKVTAEQAKLLKGIFEAHLALLQAGRIETTGQWHQLHADQLEANNLSDHGAKKDVGLMVLAQLGEEDVPLDEEMTAKLQGLLLDLGGSFNCSRPDPPTPDPGERVIIIVRESKNPPQWVVTLQNNLRRANSDANKYLREHKHKLYIVDPDSTDEDGGKSHAVRAIENDDAFRSLPAQFVLDTNWNIIGSSELSKSPEDFLAFLKANGG